MKAIIRLISCLLFFFISCDEINISNVSQNNDEWQINSTTKITYSKHAKCRMECRFIDEDEVREILIKKNINHDRTRINEKGESVAFEGITHDNQKVRIVAAKKSQNQIHIVTVIDLEQKWHCECD